MLQEGLHALFAAYQDIVAIVGDETTRDDKKDGVFPVTVPKGSGLPALIYALIAGHEWDSQDGRGELTVSRVQISGFAADTQTASGYSLAAQLREAAKDAIIGFKGLLPDGTEVHSAFLMLEQDTFESVPKIYQSLFDVEITHSKPS
jgi:hypothetical protein